MHMEGNIDASARMHPGVLESTKLTFAALNARIDALPKSPEASTILPMKAKWGFAAAIAGALLALLSTKLLPNNATYTVILSAIGVVVEIVGVVVAALSQAPKQWPIFAGERREFIIYRHARMKERLPMLTGSIEKLGVLP